METSIAGVDDTLTNSLSFKLSNKASYIIDKSYVTYHPSGSSSYAPSGVKTIKFVLNSETGWLDPKSIRLFYKFNNEDTADITVLGGPYSLIRRARLLCSGTLIEDIDYYNRWHHLNMLTSPADEVYSEEIMGFGSNPLSFGLVDGNAELRPVPIGDGRIVSFRPLFGLFQQDKFIRLKYAPLEIEFEIVSDGAECCNHVPGDADNPKIGGKIFSITNCEIKASIITLDNALDNEYASHLLSGKSLKIPYKTVVNSSQIIKSFDNNISVQRAFSRIDKIYVSFFKGTAPQPGSVDGKLKESVLFYHPQDINSTAKDIEFTLQIGSKKFPDYPIRSLSEAYYHTLNTINCDMANVKSMNMIRSGYHNNKFVLGISLEKAQCNMFSGLQTKTGSLLTLNTRPVTTIDMDANADYRIHYSMEYTAILVISDTGIYVED